MRRSDFNPPLNRAKEMEVFGSLCSLKRPLVVNVFRLGRDKYLLLLHRSKKNRLRIELCTLRGGDHVRELARQVKVTVCRCQGGVCETLIPRHDSIITVYIL